ncbi:radial spoke 3 protein [Planoprotostelium fungivorum]|uniref:Radial spoke 3 protein n=1 Tax=Planoprotostelium fungivorum TaxID=1890364 RepID=A0A2P6NLC1_9EUKA|nr:radial spoke 3 protein [Planoprotostelium fungivorum]
MMTGPRSSVSITYAFTSPPRALSNTKKKFRDPNESLDSISNNLYNIMTDPRIKRGTTVTGPPPPLDLQRQDVEKKARERESRVQENNSNSMRPNTSQMELLATLPTLSSQMFDSGQDYLEQIDRPIEKDVDMHPTDRPSSPVFVPKKEGKEAATQVWENDLFDFDKEVEPLLAALLAKVLEQSLWEVRDEEERKGIAEYQQTTDENRAVDLKETQRREEEERKKEEQKNIRLEEEKRRLEREKKWREKEAAKPMVQRPKTPPAVLDKQESIVKEVHDQFMPWLFGQVNLHLDDRDLSRSLVNDLISSALEKAKKMHREAKERAALEAEQARLREEEIGLFIEVPVKVEIERPQEEEPLTEEMESDQTDSEDQEDESEDEEA